MKFLTAVLAASVAANAALLALFAVKPTLAPPVLRSYFQSGGDASPRASATPAPVAAAKAGATTDAASRPGAIWAALDTEDLPQLIARLRAAGFSKAVVRAIINARIEKRFEARMKEIVAPLENLPFWKPDPTSGILGTTGFYDQYNQMYRDRAKAMRELLGNDYYGSPADATAAQTRQFGSLSSAKIELAQRINDDYAEMTSQVRALMQNITLPEDREKIALLEREKKADLMALMTPQEFADYEMRTSPVTSRLRTPLTFMEGTESEFQALYKIHQEFHSRINPTSEGVGIITSDMMNLRTEAQKQQAEQIKVALGEARAAEFLRASNNDYQQMYRLAQREGLPTDAANRAYAIRESLGQESMRIMNDRALDNDAKREALKTLGQGARTQLVGVLGQNAATNYAQGARWLTQVESGAGALNIGPDGTTSYRSLPMPPPSR